MYKRGVTGNTTTNLMKIRLNCISPTKENKYLSSPFLNGSRPAVAGRLFVV